MTRLRDRLGRARLRFRKKGKLDEDAWEELEESLLMADAGMEITTGLVERVRERAKQDKVRDADALPDLLESEIATTLENGADRDLARNPDGPTVWMLVGVNGVGKTTTIAKIAAHEIERGSRVLFAAADTFRAAAGEQLAHWAERLSVEVIRGQEGGDPGAVAFDAVQSAVAQGVDVVLVDTAGRLHTKVNLMHELEKVRRIVERTPGALREVLLVLDATTGQNGLTQARQFTDAVGVTGVVLTKLDGTAKGGIVLAVEAELGVPVKLVGVGEQAEDLIPFDPAEFAAALVEG